MMTQKKTLQLENEEEAMHVELRVKKNHGGSWPHRDTKQMSKDHVRKENSQIHVKERGLRREEAPAQPWTTTLYYYEKIYLLLKPQ
jgi:hypothetical protein